MSEAEIRSPDAFEERLRRFMMERAEETRAVRVGEKETSEQAAIIARYADLFTEPQLDALHAAESAADGDERERLYRLRKTCESGVVASELAEAEDAFDNALLAARVEWQGEELPLRSASARLAVMPDYAGRDDLGARSLEVSAGFNPDRSSLMQAREELEARLSGEADPIARAEEEKLVSLRELADALDRLAAETEPAWERRRAHWFERLLGPDREAIPSSFHAGWMRRLSPLEETYSKGRCVEVCEATLSALGLDLEKAPNIQLDLEDRPQKSPRACVIASDPPLVVHLITRAMGGFHDYQAFLHEAGHALHYAGCDPGLPYTFRRIARDHALTEIYSYLVESVSRQPEWHAEYFQLSAEEADENADASEFVETFLFRRYVAKLRYELGFWEGFPGNGEVADDYAARLTAATGMQYRTEAYLSDMDAGFYTADYLRAWIRSAQVRVWLADEVGSDWWRSTRTGELLTALFREGTKPTSEEIASRIGFEPLDTAPLAAELA